MQGRRKVHPNSTLDLVIVTALAVIEVRVAVPH